MAEKNIGDLKGRISMENSDFKDKMSQARAELDKTANSSKNLSRDFGAIQMASAAVGVAVVAGIGASVKIAANFEQQMSRVKAISGATDEEFKRLEASALKLGATTSKSASEVAKGMEDMAAMGFNVNEVISAMPGVIAAAEASGSDLALTAGVVAAALNSFQMEASQATKVADVLAMTANVSAASVDDMGYAFKYAAPVANTLGISMEELAAATGIMVDAGLAGSQAGTTLRMAMLRLSDAPEEASIALGKLGVTVTDSEGNFLSLAEILPQFEKGLEGMGNAQKVAAMSTIFGAEAVSGMLALIDGGTPKFVEFTGALEDSAGASKKAADIMMDNLLGSFEEFSGALETVGIQLGKEFLPLFKEIVDAGAKIVNKFGEVDTGAVKTTAAFVGITAAVAFALSTLGKLSLALSAFAMTPVGAAILAVSLLTGIVASASMAQAEFKEVNLETAQSLMGEQEALSQTIESYDRLKGQMYLTTEELSRFVDINSELARTADPALIKALTDEQNLLREKSGLTNEEFTEFLSLNDEIIRVVPESNTVLTEQGNILLTNTNNAKALNEEQLENIRIELEAQKLKAEANLKGHLVDEERLLSEMNDIKTSMAEQDQLEIDQQMKVNELTRELEAAEAENGKGSAKRLEYKVAVETAILQKYKEQQAETAEQLILKKQEVDEVQKQIGLLDEVKYQMVELEMKQAGLVAKKGEELLQIDLATIKLTEQRRQLELTTPVNKKNTEEYREAVGAIDSQISKLETARQKVVAITGEASVMNTALGRSIVKDVFVRTIGNNSIKDLEYHSGGIVGKNPLPKMHIGGTVNKMMENLKSAPLHNEVDVRLLKNEAVLTESQQSNLMRMIDAGGTGTAVNSMEETNSLLREIAEGLAEGKDISIVMNERVVGTIVEEHVTRAQKRKEEVNNVFNGKRW